MNKKGVTLTEAAIALILVITVVSFLITFGPKIWDLAKISIGLSTPDSNNIENEESETVQDAPIQDSAAKEPAPQEEREAKRGVQYT